MSCNRIYPFFKYRYLLFQRLRNLGKNIFFAPDALLFHSTEYKGQRQFHISVELQHIFLTQLINCFFKKLSDVLCHKT